MTTDALTPASSFELCELRRLIARAVDLFDAIKIAVMREAWEEGMTFEEAFAEMDSLRSEIEVLTKHCGREKESSR